jgi:hypothetical protein
METKDAWRTCRDGRGGGGDQAGLVGWCRGRLGLPQYVWNPRTPNSLTIYIYAVGNGSPGLPIDMGSPNQGSGHARGQVEPMGRVRPHDCGACLCMHKHVLYFA